MLNMEAKVTIQELMEAIGLDQLPEGNEFHGATFRSVDVAVIVDVHDIEAAGYTPNDEIPDEDDFRDDILVALAPDMDNLADGMRALLDGDRRMAATLLARALSEWPDAARVIEDILHGRTTRDRQQRVLALAI